MARCACGMRSAGPSCGSDTMRAAGGSPSTRADRSWPPGGRRPVAPVVDATRRICCADVRGLNRLPPSVVSSAQSRRGALAIATGGGGVRHRGRAHRSLSVRVDVLRSSAALQGGQRPPVVEPRWPLLSGSAYVWDSTTGELMHTAGARRHRHHLRTGAPTASRLVSRLGRRKRQGVGSRYRWVPIDPVPLLAAGGALVRSRT